MRKTIRFFLVAKLLIALFYIGVILFLPATKVSAQGTIGCLVRDEGCATYRTQCENGFKAPTQNCEQFIASNCPIEIQCVEENINEPEPPPIKCGAEGRQCCGDIPPLYCNIGLVPNNPYSTAGCFCQKPQETVPSTCGFAGQICCLGSSSCRGGNIPNTSNGACTCSGGQETPVDKPDIDAICKNLDNRAECENCMNGVTHKGKPGAYTAIGCIPTDLPTFLSEYLFTIGLGFAGGIAFLLMLWGGFNILISQGDAHKIQMGREIIVSAGVGLLFIIFAIVILQFIGKEIGIPGFK